VEKKHITAHRESRRGFRGQSVFTYTVHSKAENSSGVTGELISGVKPEGGPLDTGDPRIRQKKEFPSTSENNRHPIYRTHSEPSMNPQMNQPKYLVFPECLSSESFRAKFEEWMDYHRKRTRQNSSLRFSTFERQLKKLSEFTEAEAIAAIEASMTNGWQGLFPKYSQTPGRPRPAEQNQLNEKINIKLL
jgi:hypothetical protein